LSPEGEVVDVDQFALARSDDEGRYRFRDLAPGSYRVTAGRSFRFLGGTPGAEEHAAVTEGPVELGEGTRLSLDFTLSRGETVVVTVLDPDGNPIEGAMVRVRPANGATPVDILGGMERTDETGVATIGGLPHEPSIAVATHRDFADTEPIPFTIRAGEKTVVRLQLRTGTSLVVRVLDEAKADVPFAVAEFTDPSGHVTRSFFGNVVLVPGEYRVEVSAPGFEKAVIGFTVGAESPQELAVTLRRALTKR